MRRGNCLYYALLMRLLHGGALELRVIRAGGVPKLRFYHVSPDGARTYFAPRRPKRGLSACVDSIWYEGRVKRGNKDG